MIEIAEMTSERQPGYFLGRVQMFGRPFHLEALRVITAPDRQSSDVDDPVNETRLSELMALNDVGRFETVEIPGLDGEFVCWMTPCAG